MWRLLKFASFVAVFLVLNITAEGGISHSKVAQKSDGSQGVVAVKSDIGIPILLTDPAIADHDIGNVAFTISNFGQYGLAPTALNPSWDGIGFKMPQSDINYLFEGALLIGDGPARVSNGARDENQNLGDDFVADSDIELLEPGSFADQEYHTGFSDQAAMNPLDILVTQKSYAFSSDPDDDYVIIEYTITNTGSSTLEGVLVAHFDDWDTPWDVATDRVNFDRSRNLGYQYYNDIYRGQKVLSDLGVFSFKALDNAAEVYPPRFTLADKWDYMNAGTVDTAITSMIDCSVMITTGPYDIAPGESVVAAFAILGGDGLDDLQANADAAMEMYQVPTEEIVYFEDFESGMGYWSGEWALTNTESHSPTHSLTDSPNGNYPDYDTISVETTEDIDLTEYPGYRLEFWTKYDIELGFDYVYLDISTDGGSNWIDLHTFNGEGVDWYNFTTDLGGFTGQNVRFRLVLETDAGYNVDGMYVDDFTVVGLTSDASPPLILHEGPDDRTSVPEAFTAMATITDYSGVESAWLSYSVDGSDMEVATPDSIVGDEYYFTIPIQEAGAHVEYFISAVDTEDNEGSIGTQHYLSGSIIVYDDGDAEFVYQYGPGDKCATRFTPDETATLVTGMLKLYTDINRPIDTVDVEVWDNGSGNMPGASMIDPMAVWPMSTLEDPHAWTYVDFRGMGISVDDDFHLGYTLRSEWPVILGDSPAITGRSSNYMFGSWALATTDFHIRVVVDYGQVGVDDVESRIPKEFAIMQNYPNPFNASTVIEYSVTNPGEIELSVYNVLGQKIETLVKGHHDAGEYSITWKAGDLPSGVYFGRLEAHDRSENVKMMLLK